MPFNPFFAKNRLLTHQHPEVFLDSSVYGEYPEILNDLEMREKMDILRMLAFDENILDIYFTDTFDDIKFDRELFIFEVNDEYKYKNRN